MVHEVAHDADELGHDLSVVVNERVRDAIELHQLDVVFGGQLCEEGGAEVRQQRDQQPDALRGHGQVLGGDGLEARRRLDRLRAQHQLLGAGVEKLHQLHRLDDDVGGDGGEAEGDLQIP